ncbi:BPSS1780 family membrane protein [Xenorhabdus sp. BG5]|uniref:BPSS1780 family membrane protein n=1 Tax=Xenorhabdus sp. BG5 TaxID=2782014 RepID=UPI00187F6480|nr:BPSS1780 family membrane protein [Xenorhabdus sp. BG5]MBE8597822.1 hypothetical protein [Xenorhabdus sp. BG5]
MDNTSIPPNIERSHNSSDDEHTLFIPNGQAIGASAAIAWIGDAWDFISPKLGMWVLIGIIYGVINLSLFISDFGFLLLNLLDPLFSAGIIAICETQRMTGKFKFGKLFYGLHYKCSNLLAIGIIVCGIKILGNLISVLIDGHDLSQVIFDDFSLYSNYDEMIISDDSQVSFLSFCVSLITLFLSTACFWFAPALVILKDFSVRKALSISLSAIWKNLLGVLLFLLFIYLLFFISAIPLFLGILFTAPLSLATSYISYRSVFYKKETQKDDITVTS